VFELPLSTNPVALTNLIHSSKGFEDKVERAGQLRRP